MKRKILLLIAALALTLSAAATLPGFADATAVYASANYGSSELEVYAKQVASIVNRERAAKGLPPLKSSDTLNAAAITRAVEIETRFEHERPNGTTCFSALDEAGVDYFYAGENIAYGQKTPDRVMNAWMNSEGHRNNILNDGFKYIGVGVAYHNGTYYWTQFFAGAYNLTGNVVAYITGQPKDITVANGQNAEFSVTAGGDSLSYQWYYKKAGASDWSLWKGHTAAATSGVANATWNGMQVYCAVTDYSGFTVSSDTAVVTVVNKPVITAQPQDVTLAAGQVASFTVKAVGEKLTYQWYYKKVGDSDWRKWNGHTDATTAGAANDTWNGMQVYCEITNGDGHTVSSDPAVVTVAEKPVITAQPRSVNLALDEVASFSVKATGEGLTYQWYYKKADASDWCLWKGHTDADTAGAANASWNGMRVYCKVTNRSGVSVNSSTAGITIVEKPVITTQPKNVTAWVGQVVTFSVKATGEGLTYQWYFKKAGTDVWNKWSKQTEATISAAVNDTWDGMQVYCVITNRSGFSTSSKAATVTFVQKPVITKHPQNVSAGTGETVSFSVRASGESLGYQWYYKKQGASSWNKWYGHDTSVTTAVANATWDGMQVYCEVSNAAGGKVNSNAAVITVKPSIKITHQPKSVTTSVGKIVSFSVSAVGQGLKYQWYYKKSNSSVWNKWYNHTEKNISAAANDTWDGMQVYCEITDSYGGKVNSASAAVTLAD